MNRTITRVVGDYAHIMNTSTGEIMTFEIGEEDAQYLAKNWDNPELGLEADVVELFSVQERTSTRLCRSALNALGTEFSFPTIVNIEINRRCSLHCVHCYVGQDNVTGKALSYFEVIPYDKLEGFLDELRSLGVFMIALTGGEPFLNNRMRNITESIMDKGFALEILTNLQHLPSWFREMDFSQSLLGRVQTSVYSLDPAVHDGITGVPGSLARTLMNMRFLREKGVCVEVATPLMQANYPSWRMTKQHFDGSGIRQNFSWPIVEAYYGQDGGQSKLNITNEQYVEFSLDNPGFMIETEFLDPNAPICEAGRALFSLDAEGNVYPCTEITDSVGSIQEASITDIFHSDAMDRYRRLCCKDSGTTLARSYCIGENLLMTGDLFTQPEIVTSGTRALLQAQGRR